jgi:hypothetical protein
MVNFQASCVDCFQLRGYSVKLEQQGDSLVCPKCGAKYARNEYGWPVKAHA